MLVQLLILIVSLSIMLVSADRFVDSASKIAQAFKVSPLIIGMLIIGLGTSSPELMVSTISAINGAPELALGNAIGSNIANIGLILGITALITPVAVASKITKIELPFVLIITLILGFMLFDGYLSTYESILLLVIFIIFIALACISSQRVSHDALADQVDISDHHNKIALGFLLVISLLILIVSARYVVTSATEIAMTLGLSELIIGLTIVAIGTSLPELATSIIAAKRGQAELAIGNIVGSNVFNTLAVIGVSGAIQPIDNISVQLIYRDMSVLLLFTIFMLFMAMGFKAQGRVNQYEGLVLLIIYLGYLGALMVTA